MTARCMCIALTASLLGLLLMIPATAEAQAPTLIAQWNAGASGPFATPCAIAISSEGSVYVADTWHHQVQKFDPMGGFTSPWGDGSLFAYTMGVAVDGIGFVFVVDYGYSVVRKFTSAGSFVTQFGGPGAGNGQFTNTGGVAVDADGFVYVVDLGGHRIQKFTNAGAFVLAWGTYGSGNGQFSFTWPSGGVAVDTAGNVYVADTGNNRIQKFTSAGVFVTQWGGAGLGPGQFSAPRGVAAGFDGRVFVVEEENSRVQVFGPNGEYLDGWGTLGAGDGQFSGPRGIAVDQYGQVYVADTGNNRVQVFDVLPRLPTTMVLVSEPNPTTYGQVAQLIATVSPPEATGNVVFSDSTVVLGTVPVTAGEAALSVSSLFHGEHPLRATLVGGHGWAHDTSEVVIHRVELAPTATGVVSAVNPTLYGLPVRFVASVTPLTPIPEIPNGSIQFMVDGVPLGSSVPLVNGGASIQVVDSLPPGEHQIEAAFLPGDTLRFLASVSPAIVHVVQPSQPVITRVKDVPNDQGGKVFITWHCVLDQPGLRRIVGYRVWRRIPPFEADAVRSAGGLGEQPALADSSGPPTYWEAVALLPAAQLVSYGYTAQTTQDSLPDSNPYTAFFIQALTADVFVFFPSAPDSGYSVDNLAPLTPSPLTVLYGPTSNTLHWPSRAVADLRGYELYRGTIAAFVPSPGSLVTATAETSYVDVGGSYYYKLAAVDIHGNRSRFVAASPDHPVATLVSFVRSVRENGRVELLWYSGGNAGLEARVYRRAEETNWEFKGAISADGLGHLSFEDRDVAPDLRYGYRLGIVEPDAQEIFLGEAWSDPVETGFVVVGLGANPSVDGRVSLTLSVPASSTALVRLFDVAGREVGRRSVASGAPAARTVEFGTEDRLKAGVYILRALSGGVVLTKRVVVLN